MKRLVRLVWLILKRRRMLPSSLSQIMRVVSAEPETSTSPSSLKASDDTPPVNALKRLELSSKCKIPPLDRGVLRAGSRAPLVGDAHDSPSEEPDTARPRLAVIATLSTGMV